MTYSSYVVAGTIVSGKGMKMEVRYYENILKILHDMDNQFPGHGLDIDNLSEEIRDVIKEKQAA